MGPLDVYDFGRRLIQANDLDPVYVLLAHSGFSPGRMREWLLAYWCFYHVGTSSWIVDQARYWLAMETAAGSKDYARCPERRHFRGQNALNSVAYLQSQSLAGLFDPLLEPRTYSLKEVIDQVQKWVGFGPWIAFKVADMLERLGIVAIEFDSTAMFLFDSPKEGAQMAWAKYGPSALSGDIPAINRWVVDSLVSRLGDLKAPPRYERPINAQEAETVLCKWKSYLKGGYEIGEDIRSCREGLLRYARCRTSQTLLKAGGAGGLW